MKEFFKKIKPYLVFCFAFLSGAILFLGFSPYEYAIAGILSPGLLLWCLAKQPPSRAFLIGCCYGLGMFGLGANWVYVSIHDYGYTSELLAAFITGLFIIILALYPASMCFLFNKYFNKKDLNRNLVVYPALWTVFEILRGWLFTGFPWLFIGYTQMGTQLRAFAPIGSVFAVSWITVLVSSLLYSILIYYFENQNNPKKRNSLFVGMAMIWLIAFGASQVKWTRPTDQTLSVALVQGNIAQLMRWDPSYIATIVRTYRNLTQQVIKSDLIVWPEGAIPIPLPLSKDLFNEIDKIGKENHFALISGVPTEADPAHYYNSLIAVGDGTQENGRTYFKVQLVPFGEFVPFDRFLRGIIAFFNLPMSSFISGPSKQSSLIAKGFRFAPAICYEIAYPFYVQRLSKNVDFILTVSNDTWFGDSIGPSQHLQIAQFRALETGKYIIRATNTGFTAIIRPDSKLQVIADAYKPNVTTGNVTVMAGQTFWVSFGPWPLTLCLVITLLAGFWWQFRVRK